MIRATLFVLAGVAGILASLLTWVELTAAGEFGLREVRWWLPWGGAVLASGAGAAGAAGWRRLGHGLAFSCVLLWLLAAWECWQTLQALLSLLGETRGGSSMAARLWASAEIRAGAWSALGAITAWLVAAFLPWGKKKVLPGKPSSDSGSQGS